jgi:threonine dehydratase
MNFDRLRFIAERAELGEHREAVLAVTIPEKAGAFKAFCRLLGNRNITEFNYRYSDPETRIFLSALPSKTQQEAEQLVQACNQKACLHWT